MPWYVRHAERYLKAHASKRLAKHSVDDVKRYLDAVGRRDRIEDWQFEQIVEVVRNLLVTANAAVVGEVDWAYWRDSARSLAGDHPTIAREGPVGPRLDGGAHPMSKARGLRGEFARAKRPQRLPVVLTCGEVARLLDRLDVTQQRMAALLYGTGMRLMECVRLRVQDLDFEYHQIIVRDGKGQKDRVVPLPKRLELPLKLKPRTSGRDRHRWPDRQRSARPRFGPDHRIGRQPAHRNTNERPARHPAAAHGVERSNALLCTTHQPSAHPQPRHRFSSGVPVIHAERSGAWGQSMGKKSPC